MNSIGRVESGAVVDDPWMAHMRRGDWEAAWRMSDEALRNRKWTPCWRWPRHLQYVWDGRPLNGKRVLVRCYHGLGDTVQFIRYIPLLKAIAREVIVWVQPKLMPLLQSMREIDELLPLNDGNPGVEYDVDVELMELPHVFRTTLETLPHTVPYLSLPRSDVRPLRSTAISASHLKVGLVWRAGEWDEQRSIPVHVLQSLLQVSGVRWVALQHGMETVEVPPDSCVVIGDHSIEEAAALMETLDLVITVDTLAAHLAGALAVSTWTLLQAQPDWRWMDKRADTPWYPTMKLFRQTQPGDWPGVIAQVAKHLRDHAALHPDLPTHRDPPPADACVQRIMRNTHEL